MNLYGVGSNPVQPLAVVDASGGSPPPSVPNKKKKKKKGWQRRLKKLVGNKSKSHDVKGSAANTNLSSSVSDDRRQVFQSSGKTTLGVPFKTTPTEDNNNGDYRLDDDTSSIISADTSTCTASITSEQLQQPHPCNNNNNEQSEAEEEGLQQVYLEACKFNFRDFMVESLGEDTPHHQKTALLAAKQRLSETIHQDYTEALLGGAFSGAGVSELDMHILASRHILDEFISVLPMIRSAPMAGTMEELVFETIENYIRPRISDNYRTSMDYVSPGDAAKIIAFINDDLLSRIEETCPDLSPAEEPGWIRDRDALVEIYMERGVRGEMKKLLERSSSLLTDQDIYKDTQKNVFTGNPEQIAFMVNSQLSVAKETLPEEYWERVLFVCNQEISDWIVNVMLEIGSNWKYISSRRYCATVNDAARLADQIEERNESYLKKPEYVEAGAELCREISELALHATSFLCEHIMLSLCEPVPILTRIGDAEWENDETGSTLGQTIATLKDYFYDLEEWLIKGDYYYPKVLQKCLDLTLQMYIESFFANTMVHGIKSAERASGELNEDYLQLVIFFNGSNFENYHGVPGLDPPQVVNSRLHIIQCLSRVVDPDLPPEVLQADVKSILRQLYRGEESGIPAVLHLAGLRKQHTAEESVEWLRVIAQAFKEVKKETNVDDGSFIGRSCRYRGGEEEEHETRRKSPTRANGRRPSFAESLRRMSSSIGSSSCNNDARSKKEDAALTPFKLPDLRNSRYIHNIKSTAVTRLELNRKLSKGSIATAAYANTLLLVPKRIAIQNAGKRLVQRFHSPLPTSKY